MDINQLKTQYKAGERDFSEVQLSGINLVWVELTGVNFQGADFSHSNLSGANLSECNFSNAANLTFTDLSRADLRNTNLRGTRLEGANLESVQLEGATYDETTTFPIGFDPLKAGAIATGALQPAAIVSESVQSDGDLEQYAASYKANQTGEASSSRPISTRYFQESPPNPALETAKELFQKIKRAANDVFNNRLERQSTNTVAAPSIETVNSQADDVYNTSGQGKSGLVPPSVKGSWNWGAFLLPWFWFLTNQVWFCAWIWLLLLVPVIGNWLTLGFAITMAANGNRWAWQSRKWNSVRAFKLHQRAWAVAGVIYWSLLLFLNLFSRH